MSIAIVISVQMEHDIAITEASQISSLSNRTSKNRFGLAAQRVVGGEVCGRQRRDGIELVDMGTTVAGSAARFVEETCGEQEEFIRRGALVSQYPRRIGAE